MAYHNNIQLTLIINAPPDQAEEGDRLFRIAGGYLVGRKIFPRLVDRIPLGDSI
jgi:hypothetical protein